MFLEQQMLEIQLCITGINYTNVLPTQTFWTAVYIVYEFLVAVLYFLSGPWQIKMWHHTDNYTNIWLHGHMNSLVKVQYQSFMNVGKTQLDSYHKDKAVS